MPWIHIVLVIVQTLAPIVLPMLGIVQPGSASQLALSGAAALGAAGTTHHYHKRRKGKAPGDAKG